MEKLLKKYNESFSENINLSISKVVQIIAREKDKRSGFFDYFNFSTVDFSEVIVSNEKIIIDVKPKMLNPFRGMGEIRMNLLSSECTSKTIIDGEIIPYNNLYRIAFYMVMVFLALWTSLVLLTTSGKSTFIMVTFGWTIFPLILFLLPYFYRSNLREYRDAFLAILKDNINKNKSIY